MDILKPKATVEQDFMLMLHDRIIELEKLVDKQATEINHLRKHQTPLSYNILKNSFTNDASIQWDIRRPVNEAEIIFHGCGYTEPIGDVYLDSHVIIDTDIFEPGEKMAFNLPIFRECSGMHKIEFVLSELKLRVLLQSIHDFYHSQVTNEQLEALDNILNETSLDYCWNIKLNRDNVTWLQMLTSTDNNIWSDHSLQVNFCGGESRAEYGNINITVI